MEYELHRHPYCIDLTWAKEPELLGNAKGTCHTAWKVEGIRIRWNTCQYYITPTWAKKPELLGNGI